MMLMNTFHHLLKDMCASRAAYLVLLDPDRCETGSLIDTAVACQEEGADGLLIGGSLLFTPDFDEVVRSIKNAVTIPVILFPGSGYQISGAADGLLFLSLISGRNPHYLIQEQVLAAPRIKSLGLETVPCAYMLIESSCITSVECVSNTKPLPRNKPELAAAHAMAASCLGFSHIYLEAGSGAREPVPCELIRCVRQACNLSLIVGGGISTPETAAQKVEAGASFIVTGTVIEGEGGKRRIADFADAVHSAGSSND